ncbi:MAG: restriction endonuclease [Burkholderiales bacterium]
MAAKGSLFEILKRKHWWVSVAIAMGIAGVMQLFLPLTFAIFAGLPFLVIAIYVAWRQRGVPGEARTEKILGEVRSMNREEFESLVEDAFVRDGFKVSKHESDAADIEIRKGGRTNVVLLRRWKTAQNGIGPLRDLHEAVRTLGASGGVFIATGEISDTARQFAAEHAIELGEDAALAKLLAPSLKRRALR